MTRKNLRARNAALALCTVLCIGLTTSFYAKAVTILFDPPGSKSTVPTSINSTGVVAGWYDDGHVHSFVRTPDGTITTFDVAPYSETEAQSINDSGTVVGSYIDQSSVWHGYVRTSDGTIVSFDAPGSNATWPYSINSSGAITGVYDGSHGFVRAADGTFTEFDPSESEGTVPVSINAGGSITGWYLTNNCQTCYRGFVRTPDGTITPFDMVAGGVTFPRSINSKGVIAGDDNYWDRGSVRAAGGGFVRAVNGTITTFGQPSTMAMSINDNGVVAGWYMPGINFPRPSALGWVGPGFERTKKGVIKQFLCPKSGLTNATSINLNGEITGSCFVRPVMHGFVRTP